MSQKSSPQKKSFWDLKKIPPFPVCWNRLKTLRLNLGLTQVQLAVKVNVSPATLFVLEAGNDTYTTPETKKKLCDFFGCEVDQLFPVSMIGPISKQQYLEKKLKEDQEALVKSASEK